MKELALLLFFIILHGFVDAEALDEGIDAVLLHRKLHGCGEELGKGEEDHEEEDEVCGRFDAEKTGEKDGNCGENADCEEHQREKDPKKCVIDIEFGAACFAFFENVSFEKLLHFFYRML